MSKVLITGAAGNVGYEVIRAYPRPDELRAAVWDVNTEPQKIGRGIDCVRFDFTDPSTYAAAFDGVRSLFLMRPPQLSNVPRDIEPALDAAQAAGVEHIVFLSLVGVERRKYVPHYKIEQAILARGFDYTFLRASFFMQNLSTTHRADIAATGEIALPVGSAKTSFIDVRDIGAVAALALSEPGHRNRAYTLTGGEALDYDQVARIMSEVLGRDIRYTRPNPLSFFYQQVKAGRKPGFSLVMTALYTVTRMGGAESVSDDAARLLHRPPISFRQYVEDHRAAW